MNIRALQVATMVVVAVVVLTYGAAVVACCA